MSQIITSSPAQHCLTNGHEMTDYADYMRETFHVETKFFGKFNDELNFTGSRENVQAALRAYYSSYDYDCDEKLVTELHPETFSEMEIIPVDSYLNEIDGGYIPLHPEVFCESI